MLRTLRFRIGKNIIGINKRSLWKWVDDTFNRIDDDRIEQVGPNMACAEWLMKNGAKVRWKGCKEFVSHYDNLPGSTGGSSLDQFRIEQVYAGKEASISHIGFGYFKNCESISEIAFVGCHTVEDEALDKLQILKNNLARLKIDRCVNISNKGILTLGNLQMLKHLELKNLQTINLPKIISYLETKLPECDIQYN